MKIGAHISAAGDISLAPERSQKIGGECFQFFSRPPQGGKGKDLTVEKIRQFQENMKIFGQAECYIHAPYYINLASVKNNIYFGSISIINEELNRGSLLGVKYLMTHLGSAKELGEKESLKKVIEGLKKILENYQGSTQLLVEISAGSGSIIGDTFDEIAAIIKKIPTIGVCFDTAHAFASGYDLRDKKSVKKTFEIFDNLIGLDKLKLIHANDSQSDFNSKKDRHEHIGQGKIGLEGFQNIVDMAKKNQINLILETPHDDKLEADIKLIKKIRK